MSRPGVVVPAYRAAQIVPRSVAAFRAQTLAADWVFVDDGSDDGTAAALDVALRETWAAPGSTARVLRQASNGGRAAARNAGIAALPPDADPVVFLDVDVEPPPGLLGAFLTALQDPGAVAAVARIRPASSEPDGPYLRYLHSSLRGPGAAEGPVPWRHFVTTASAVSRNALDAAGGFDTRVGYGEDLDLAARLAAAAPTGLRLADAPPVAMHEAGTLETALAKVDTFARDTLPTLLERHAALAAWTRADTVLGRDAGWPGLVVRHVLRPAPARLLRPLVPRLPTRIANLALRYVVAERFAAALRAGVRARAWASASSPDAPAQASAWAEARLLEAGAPSELVDRAALAVGEAVDNAVTHGRPPVRLSLHREIEGWTFTLSEGGPGPNPASLRHAELPADASATRGRGLYLLRTLTDGVEGERGRLVLRFRPRTS